MNILRNKIKILIKKKTFPLEKKQNCLASKKSMIVIFHEQTPFMSFKTKKTTNPKTYDSCFNFGPLN